jgi:hypothetical protein
MPRYIDTQFPYDEYVSEGTKTFVYENRPTAIYWPTEKKGSVIEGRQAHFVSQLLTLREQFGRCIPIHIRWSSGAANQMDKGCIGHAFGASLPIQSVGIAVDGEITHIILWDNYAPNN